MKSQASFEVMILIGFLIAISIGFILLFQNQFSITGTSSQLSIKNICINIANKINNAYEYGRGFEQNITLPQSLNNQSYNVTVAYQTLFCTAGDSTFVVNLLTNDVKNSTSDQPFQIPAREIKIKNVDGVIMIL